MSKRLLSTIALACCLTFGLSASASAITLDVTIDGETIGFTEQTGSPFVDENDRLLVPIRSLMEAYGCQVQWDEENKIANLTQDDTEVQVPLDKNFIVKNGVQIESDTAAVSKDERIYLPLRIILESFGATVNMSTDGTSCIVTSPKPEPAPSKVTLSSASVGSDADDTSDLILDGLVGQAPDWIDQVNLLWPTPGFTYISNNYRDGHQAIDIAGSNITGTPVLAAADGVVTTWSDTIVNGYGIYAVVTHQADDLTYATLYAHMSAIEVSLGDEIEQGDVIGYVGATGNATGPHLHFEVRTADKSQVNPFFFF